jgi:hypothetical protein
MYVCKRRDIVKKWMDCTCVHVGNTYMRACMRIFVHRCMRLLCELYAFLNIFDKTYLPLHESYHHHQPTNVPTAVAQAFL